MAKNSEKPLTVEDLCIILKSCAENHVSSLQWREVDVSFHQSVKPEPPQAEEGKSAKPLSQKQHDELNKKSIELDELRLRDEQFANLPIEDPVEFEEQLMGEDVDDGDANDADDETA